MELNTTRPPHGRARFLDPRFALHYPFPEGEGDPLKLKPRPLQEGQAIGIPAPAGPVNREQLEYTASIFESWGYRVVFGEHIFERHGYLAGSDFDRAADLNAMFRDGNVHAIICARGGYGSPRLLDLLDYDAIRTHPKIFLGYSDVTALHLAISRKTGLVTFHGPMAMADPKKGMPEFNAGWMQRALTETAPLGEIANPAGGPAVCSLVGGKASGELVGGNLSLICSTLGTPYEIDTRGKLLFIEDVDEAPYRMDRMLTQLVLAGKIRDAVGVVFGESVGCEMGEEGKPSLTLEDVIEEVLVPQGKPLIYGLACGHGEFKATLPIGVMATLDADREKFYIEEAALD